jgi:acylphosphatase
LRAIGAAGKIVAMERIRRRAIVHGRVQGVFFRDTTRRKADRG